MKPMILAKLKEFRVKSKKPWNETREGRMKDYVEGQS